MRSENTSIIISELKNHLDRVSTHVSNTEQQLKEVVQLKNERYGALSEIVGGFEEFLNNEVPNKVPERDDWQNTINTAKDFLDNLLGK